MNLREEILRAHSVTQRDKIIAWVGSSQSRMDELVKLFLEGEYRVTQRAGWPLSYIARRNSSLVKKHLPKLIRNLATPDLHNAVIRNTIRLLQDVPIPAIQHGKVMDICFRYVEDPQQPVAIKAFALTVVTKLAGSYPEIIPEIRLMIEEQLPHQTAAFKSRAKRSVKLFDKIEKRKSEEEGEDG